MAESIKVLLPSTIGRMAMKANYQFPKHIQALQRACLTTILSKPEDGHNRLVVECPVRHGKSFYVSWHLAAWYLIMFPHKHVIFLSYGGEFSTEWSIKVNRTVKEFGKTLTGAEIDKVGDTVDHFTMTQGGSYRALGVGGSLSGKGADLIICDDLVRSFEEAENPAARDKLSKWFWSEAINRLEPGGKIIMVMARRHPDDQSGRLLASNEELPPNEQWESLKFPALNEDDVALWPEKWTAEKLKSLRDQYAQAGQAYLFDCLYQQNPRADSGGLEFPKEYFTDIWVDNLPPMRPKLRVLALDPSLGKHAKNRDYQAFCDMIIMPDDIAYVRCYPQKLNAAQINDYALFLVQESIKEGIPYNGIIIESNNFQEYMAEMILQNLQRNNIRIRLDKHETSSNADKETRIRNSLTYELANNRLKFISKKHCPGNAMLYNEIMSFPTGQHDDCIDSVSLAYNEVFQLLHGVRTRPAPPPLRLV